MELFDDAAKSAFIIGNAGVDDGIWRENGWSKDIKGYGIHTFFFGRQRRNGWCWFKLGGRHRDQVEMRLET